MHLKSPAAFSRLSTYLCVRDPTQTLESLKKELFRETLMLAFDGARLSLLASDEFERFSAALYLRLDLRLLAGPRLPFTIVSCFANHAKVFQEQASSRTLCDSRERLRTLWGPHART